MEGLWTVEFGSNVGMFGGGVVVLKDGELKGGDGGYYYLGSFELKGNKFQATIRVFPFLKGYESVFRTFDKDLTLELVGSLTDETHGVAQGHPIGRPDLTLGVKMTKRG